MGYEYDALSRLSAVNDAKSGQTVYGYDEVGNLESYTYPNLVRSEYQYDSLNRLTNLASGQLLTPIANYAYTVGPAGNRLTATEQLYPRPLNPQPKTINRVYTYDNIYRLTGETINRNSEPRLGQLQLRPRRQPSVPFRGGLDNVATVLHLRRQRPLEHGHLRQQREHFGWAAFAQ